MHSDRIDRLCFIQCGFPGKIASHEYLCRKAHATPKPFDRLFTDVPNPIRKVVRKGLAGIYRNSNKFFCGMFVPEIHSVPESAGTGGHR